MPAAIESLRRLCSSAADARTSSTCEALPGAKYGNHTQSAGHQISSYLNKSRSVPGLGSRQWRCTTTILLLSSSLLLAFITILTEVDSAPQLKSPSVQTSKGERAERHKRAATARLDRLWDDAVIPYEIDQLFSDERASLFRLAMRHWENYTCIKFVERIPEEHKNYIVFTERSCGCCSFVGKRGNGPQAISIGKHCDKFGIVVHELGHVVGFWHEHTRPDRDQHVQIIGKNIMAGQEYNFNKLTKDEVNSLGLAYDYDSILHYATNTFAKDVYLDTILPLHGLLNTEEVSQTPSASPSTTATSVVAAVKNASLVAVNNQTILGPTNRMAPNSSQTAPHMINDQIARNITQIRQLIEFDFQSMLEYGNGTSGTKINQRSKRSSYDSQATKNRIMIIDGSSVLISLADDLPHKRRSVRSSMPVDFDDRHHMLATDNLLAKTRPEIGQRVRLSVGDIAQTNLLYKCPKCGRTIHQLSGIFHSPDYYRESVDRGPTKSSTIDESSHPMDLCEWRLTVGLGERIMIEIMDLNIARSNQLSKPAATSNSRLGMPKPKLDAREIHDIAERDNFRSESVADPMIMSDCSTDYLEVRDGYTYRAPVIARLCGQFVAIKDSLRPIVSTSNRLLVVYRSSSFPVSKRGFLAQHETVCGGTIMLGGINYDPLINLQSPPTSSPPRSQADLEARPPSTTASSAQSKSSSTGSLTSENEVLLSSQNNVRYNQQQGSDGVSVANGRVATENIRTRQSSETAPASNQSVQLNLSLNSTTSQTPKSESKYFSWDAWPILNSTIIQSPNWPEHYRASRECLWRVKAEENHQILLRFEAFDLESHDSCAYDYVEIRDGDSSNNNIIGRYCSNRVPEQVISSGSNLLIKFVSDSDVNKAGFIASLHLEVDECKLGTHGCSYKCSNAAVPYKCECPNGLELAPDGRNCIPTCGGLRNESSGQITSPSFPDLYPISTRCIWDIHAPAHHRITLNFTHFDLEGIRSQECDYDFVEIWSRVQDSKYIRNGIFCGSHQGFSITSVANFMRIEFNSDNSIQKSGFEAEFFIDRDECATNNGGCQHICTNNIGSYQCSCNNGFVLHENKHDCIGSRCLHHITSPEGSFHSPDFPSLYQPNKECGWIFATAPGHRIKLIFDQFDLESHQECAYDHVAVFDGQTMDDHLLGRFCGSRKPLTLVSSYNLLYLAFRSDATNERRGFNATHSTVCGGRLQASLHQNGLIYSHPLFDGTTHYNRNEDCDWIIEVGENQRVRAEFTFFSLEADANCNYDQTLVYDGADDSAAQIARLCGTDLPKEQLRFQSTAESMLIIFKSDDSINSRGFSLTYSAVEIIEDETLAITHTHQQHQHTSSHQ